MELGNVVEEQISIESRRKMADSPHQKWSTTPEYGRLSRFERVCRVLDDPPFLWRKKTKLE